ETVFFVLLRWRRDEVSKRLIAIGQRIKSSDCASHRMNPERIDYTTGKRHAGERIDRKAKEALRKIAVALQQRRNVCDACNSFARTRSFVVAKDEGPIAYDGTANRAA